MFGDENYRKCAQQNWNSKTKVLMPRLYPFNANHQTLLNRNLPTNTASVQKGEHFVIYFIYLDIVSQTHRLKLFSCLSLLRTWNHGHTPRLATRMDGRSRKPSALLTAVSPVLAKRLADRNHSGTFCLFASLSYRKQSKGLWILFSQASAFFSFVGYLLYIKFAL